MEEDNLSDVNNAISNVDKNIFPVSNQLYVLTKTHRFMKINRENYLRSDISCLSVLCRECKNNDRVHLLAKDANHYVLPAVDVLQNYLDLFEIGNFGSVILTQTSCTKAVYAKGNRFWRRIRDLIRDPFRNYVLFMNQFHSDCYLSRDSTGETTEHWHFRLVYETALFYYRHLLGAVPIIVLTENETFRTEYGSKNANVFVLSLLEYLNIFVDQNLETKMVQMFEDLNATLNQTNEVGISNEFEEYLPASIWQRDPKRYLVGTLRVNRYKPLSEAFVAIKHQSSALNETATDENSELNIEENFEDVFISGLKDRNRSINGDSVVVELYPKGNKDGHKLVGKIVAVAQRKWRDYVCTVQQMETIVGGNKSKLLSIPYDARIPKIRVGTSMNYSNLQNQRILVRLDNWPSSSMYPNGHLLQIIGPVNDLETEIQCILFENELLVRPFTDAQLNEVPKSNEWVIPKQEMDSRADLRKSHLIYSIDPAGCQDVDDTLSATVLDDGATLQLGVHIADVSFFVRPSSLVDLEASKRTTTVYLADRRFDMIPEGLSTDLCSLWSGVDRLAVSVLWDFDFENLNLKKVWYGRTLIRSHYKLQYETAQAVFDKTLTDSEARSAIKEIENVTQEILKIKMDELHRSICQLVRISAHLNSKRKGLELEGVEVDVRIDKNSKNIDSITPKSPLLVHEVVAECMIFANQWVAKKLLESFPTKCLLRSHKPPSDKKLGKLRWMANVLGFDIDCSSNQALANSLNSISESNNPEVARLLKANAVLAMQRATYVNSGNLVSEFSHYGLNLECYTHFTSPIRRYADIIVHRQLLAAINSAPGSDGEQNDQNWTSADLSDLCDAMNDKHYAAQNAQRASVELFQTLFFKSKRPNDPSLLVDGVVSDILNDRLIIVVSKYGIRGPCFLRNTENLVHFNETWVNGTLSFDDNNSSVTINSGSGTKTVKLFQNVTVRLLIVESPYHASRFQFTLPEISHSGNEDEVIERNLTKGDIMTEIVHHLNQLKLDAIPTQLKPAEAQLEPTAKKKRVGNVDRSNKQSLYHFLLDEADSLIT